MLSLNQAIEIKESILTYLKATFNFQDKKVYNAFYDFIEDPKNGMFKGPYLSLKLPFVKNNLSGSGQIPLEIKPDWTPYDHQVKSWKRLSTQNNKPEHTIITTGTGSGKTESFLYPILDYCYRNIHTPGIKAIILYPMNALATDQAKRLAEAIHNDERLNNKLTAGLFIGEGRNASKHPKTMGSDHIVENRDAIIASPPDILLTNFKMLDYGLMKANYHNLWESNLNDTQPLKFIVLDELHTYDGAQGSDVANLIRRLKMKLSIPNGQLCSIGTSATIGSGDEAPNLLAEYGSRIFGETITRECIIGENRQGVEGFFGEDEKLDAFMPRENILIQAKPSIGEEYEEYINRQINVWQLDHTNLVSDLKSLKIVKDLVAIVNEGRGFHTLKSISKNLAKRNENFRDIPQWNEIYQFRPDESIIQSLFALIAEAKEDADGHRAPFLFAQTQLWIRELSGLLRLVDDQPKFVWKEDIEHNSEIHGLPPYFCRECGASGWLTIKHDNKERFEVDVNDIYAKFFQNHKHIFLANNTNWLSAEDVVKTGYKSTDTLRKQVNKSNLEFEHGNNNHMIDITAFRKITENGKNDHVCPECNTRNVISIIGTRIATLSSVAVSQVLSSDLDSQPEKHRKVLAFTNAVQDAAHQAGFIEARNYRFTFRSSLQKIINQLNEPIKLTELNKTFVDYWKVNADKRGDKNIDAYYKRFFPTDYIGKSSPEAYKKGNKYNKIFCNEFDTRLQWEIWAEFGYNALIGRTLEKTMSSGVYIQPEVLKKVWEEINPWLNRHDFTQTIQKDDFIRFIALVLHRIRIRGAISHPYYEKFRTGALRLWDLNWNRDNRHFLNRYFGKRSRLPKLITTQKDSSDVLDSTYTEGMNWFHSYFTKTFQQANTHNDFINEFYQELFRLMVDIEILDKRTAGDIDNYALNPKLLFITNQVKKGTCIKCGHEVFLTNYGADIKEGKCLNYRCNGTYLEEKDHLASNYYQMVYNRKRSPRIYSKEHTGMLDRKDREELEHDFKFRNEYDSVNALVATSTLEMGIDIGSLNIAINNSVPPLPANYLQRIGRAGRSSGSALIVNFAKKDAHDLYYYKEPLDMMDGEVHTPGCFLQAKEILKRHFFAFCIDSWTANDPDQNKIPGKIQYLKLENTDLNDSGFFINKILSFIKTNEKQLLDKFFSYYSTDISSDVIEELSKLLSNESFYHAQKQVFEKIKNTLHEINIKAQELKTRIAELNLGEIDQERKELEQEIRNFNGLRRSIKERQVIEHLTNIGALPNYAFPEKGTLLAARVLRSRPEHSHVEPEPIDFEINRPASQALRELAPDNFFYSQSYRFRISGLNTFEWSDTAVFHKKRFCSNCDYIAFADINEQRLCPKCGHESFGAESNIHYFLKLNSVRSVNNEFKSKLADTTEEREELFFNISRHFTFNEQGSQGAFAMKEIPFGIEFVDNVSMIDINLGKGDVVDARKTTINGTEVPVHGFITCKYCGKSSSNIKQPDYKQHYSYCKYKHIEYSGVEDELFKEIFLFRELQTEVLKVLLPVQEFNTEADINMFKAGLELGLKKFFKGNPQHIQLSPYREFNHQTHRFDQYLIMVDTIPGGTGYLAKLFDKEVFSEMLYKAYEQISTCSCQFEGKDGCYRCIFSYSNQYIQHELSRDRAEEKFREIIEKKDAWDSHPEGLGAITNSGQIEESELEDRFVRSLQKYSDITNDLTFTPVNINGTINYEFTCHSEEGNHFEFLIQPQVNLGPADGIMFHTRPDFLVVCTKAIVKGTPLDPKHKISKIAIYLDGFEFHAGKENNRFETDVQKRLSIIASQQYYTWTLTWQDMEQFDQVFLEHNLQKNKADVLTTMLQQEPVKDVRTRMKNSLNINHVYPEFAENNMERLITLLKYPCFDEYFFQNWTVYISFFQERVFMPSYHPDKWREALDNKTQDNYCVNHQTIDGWVPFYGVKRNALFDLKAIVNLRKFKVIYQVEINHQDSIEKADWQQFWSLFNIFQFFDNKKDTEITEAENEAVYDISDLLSQFDEKYHSVLRKVYEVSPINSETEEEKLYMLVDENGQLIAEADLIIEQKKVVFEPLSEEDARQFRENGYEIKLAQDIKDFEL